MVWSALGRGLLAFLCAGVLLGVVASYIPGLLVLPFCIGVFVWAAKASTCAAQSVGEGVLYGLFTATPACVGAAILGVVITLAMPAFTLFTNMVVASMLAAPVLVICILTGVREGMANQKRNLQSGPENVKISL